MRRKDKKNTVKVGAFVGGLLLIFMVMVMSIRSQSALFEPKVELRGRVTNVSALKEGSYVELKGIRVGTVKKISIISEDEVEVVMSVSKDKLKWVRKDSKMAISTVGLVGDKFVEIYGGSKESPPINPDKDVLSADSGSDIKHIMAKGESVASATERILLRIDHLLEKLEEEKKVSRAVDSLLKTSLNLEKVSEDLKDSNLRAMIENLNNTSTSANKILHRIEKGPGSLNALIYDDSLHDDLKTLLGGAERNRVIKYFIRESIKSAEEKN